MTNVSYHMAHYAMIIGFLLVVFVAKSLFPMISCVCVCVTEQWS